MKEAGRPQVSTALCLSAQGFAAQFARCAAERALRCRWQSPARATSRCKRPVSGETQAYHWGL